MDFPKLLLFVNASIPAMLLAWDASRGRLGTNPQEYVIHTTGTLTLVMLMVTLAVTPLRKLLQMPPLIKLRRMAGLFAFFYGCLHMLAYSWFDKELNLGLIVQDTLKRPFIFLGMFGFLLLIPLAATSTNRMVKRLGGQRWKRLHWAVYLAAMAGVLHYYLLVKADTRIPLSFAGVLGVLLGYRLFDKYRPKQRSGQPGGLP